MSKRIFTLVTLGLVLAVLWPAAAGAATFRSDDSVTIRDDQTVNDDLYIGSGSVQVDGIVNGDVIMAGGTINVDGTVNGDIIAAGGQMSIGGKVSESVRIAGGNIVVQGEIGGDLFVAGGNVSVNSEAQIARDLVVGAGIANIDGDVGRNIRGGAGTAVINGSVGNDIRIDVDELTLGSGANIGGDVRYTSENRANVASGAEIEGSVRRTVPPAADRPDRFGAAFVVGTFLLSLAWLLIVGVVLLALFPRQAREIAGTIPSTPWKSLGLGLVLLIVTPFAILILLITLLGIPIAIIGLLLYALAIYLTKVYVGFFVGDWLLGLIRGRTTHWFWALLVGLIIILLLALIPFLGLLVRLAVVLFGLGALGLALSRMFTRTRQAEAVK